VTHMEIEKKKKQPNGLGFETYIMNLAYSN
jgi:hypothetical protein